MPSGLLSGQLRYSSSIGSMNHGSMFPAWTRADPSPTVSGSPSFRTQASARPTKTAPSWTKRSVPNA